ncbi:MAG: S49 family peptidase [Gammaproteobacteria bacterium]|nr:MAG: S49 family peptidase [Gammaproteobacteria bacterium]
MSEQQQQPGWERDAIERLAREGLVEQRRSRRWGIFFKLLGFAYLFVLLGLMVGNQDIDLAEVEPHVALVDLKGLIADEEPASADNVVKGLRDAFEAEKSVGVILRVNSPGGSPVQAAYINREIRRLRKEYPDKHIYAVITDIGASGGYYAAVAAERIYADAGSIVGSIGVRMDGFGFVDAMHKLGIERRLLTAGEHKGMLDPFLPEREDEVAHVRHMLDQIHQQFINVVKEGRGDRLKDDPSIFSGLFWTGEEALKLGLVDGLASPGEVARSEFEQENIVDYTVQEGLLDQLTRKLGSAAARTLVREGLLGAPLLH